ncbi:sialic acid-binding Ig-like lectin 12 [Aquarana catesbeiana]|uniref:sialic acid-binding Ig-like lectin 12 n=1 Tax=Aquarana catesbeiana TaxID=8400 RepID=UPI003CCA6591
MCTPYKSNTRHENNGRFFLVGDVWRGDCSLYIEEPLYEDDGSYQFSIEEDNIRFTYRDVQPYVEVTELTIKPEISPIKSWLDEEEVTLSCTSPGTCLWRTPKITWRRNIQNTIVKNQVKTHKNVTKTHFSTTTFTARKEQNNSTLLCIVQLKRGLTVAQQITMKVKSKHKNISEVKSYCTITGNRIECTCIVQSFPEASIRWKIDDQFYYSSDEDIHISTSRSALVINSTLSLQLSQKDIPYIKCISSNNYGELVLDLLYKKCKYLLYIKFNPNFRKQVHFDGCPTSANYPLSIHSPAEPARSEERRSVRKGLPIDEMTPLEGLLYTG